MIGSRVLGLPRNIKRLIVLFVDLLLLPLALWFAFSLRLGELYLPQDDIRYLFVAVPLIAIPIFVRLGLYRAIIRYIGFQAMWAVVKAVSLYTLAWGVLVLLSAIPGVPRSVLLINWLVAVLLIGSSRAFARWWLTGNFKPGKQNKIMKKVVIYGAGSAGMQIASALLGSGSGFKPIAYIDDNKSLQGNFIGQLRVYSFAQLSLVIDDLQCSEILLAMPSISRHRRNQIISMLEPYTVHIITLPGVDDLASGKVKVEDVREVGVRDLLGREAVIPNDQLLNANVKGKVVLVTGAGGSIGSELCRQIIKIEPKQLILYEQSEHALYVVENELRGLALRLNQVSSEKLADHIVPILASVTNQKRLEMVCSAFGVQTIYHAAAYKHVPMVEKNPLEAITNNVLGTYSAGQAAVNTSVETFVLISTDKAVRPTNTMGASKRFAEMILQGLSKQKSATRFTMVRFGNVLGSSGSVVPLFRDQIKKGGPITVTDPKIIRYFMTIPEASQLVIQAGAMGKGGDVFVLDMGEPVKIVDLAKRMIRLSGFEVKDEDNPNGDIEIAYTGLRPGEKLYEELLIGDNVSPTEHDLIMTAEEENLSWAEIQSFISQFVEANETGNVEQSRRLLMESVSGYSPQCDVADLVFGQRQRNSNVSNVVDYRNKRRRNTD